MLRGHNLSVGRNVHVTTYRRSLWDLMKIGRFAEVNELVFDFLVPCRSETERSGKVNQARSLSLEITCR